MRNRVFFPFSTLLPTLLPDLILGDQCKTFELCITPSFLLIVPLSPCLAGFKCFVTILTPSTLILLYLGKRDFTLPTTPLSSPLITTTVSPNFTCIFFIKTFPFEETGKCFHFFPGP